MKDIQNIQMQFSENGQQLWNQGLKKNQDSYGAAIYRYAETWAKLMQLELSDGKELKDIADQTSHAADTEGITGFMYGAAVYILASTWIHGEELRKWHNKDYGHEGEGVVNPAIITIKGNSKP